MCLFGNLREMFRHLDPFNARRNRCEGTTVFSVRFGVESVYLTRATIHEQDDALLGTWQHIFKLRRTTGPEVLHGDESEKTRDATFEKTAS